MSVCVHLFLGENNNLSLRERRGMLTPQSRACRVNTGKPTPKKPLEMQWFERLNPRLMADSFTHKSFILKDHKSNFSHFSSVPENPPSRVRTD